MDVEKDFSRDVWCLLGLPFDAIDLDQACAEIEAAVENRQSCFFSTPNLNFLCAAQHDPTFRHSVINSELSVADGFPIVMLAKLLNIPIPERVAGSDLIDKLYGRSTSKPIKVFFFGGEPGVGEKACQKVNAKTSGLQAVGHFAPGFGTIDEMSSPDIIERINRHDIDFLVVSLGAKKGQAWIEKNKALLKAPVISHLGAVINFFAGTVIRAPLIWQKLGLEWLWRIYQEPNLWRRYYNDGMDFLKLLATCAIPYALWLRANSHSNKDSTLTIDTGTSADGSRKIILTGACIHSTIAPVRSLFKQAATESGHVAVDLSHVSVIDSAFLGLCLILLKHVSAKGYSFYLCHPNQTVSRILRWHRAGYLFN